MDLIAITTNAGRVLCMCACAAALAACTKSSTTPELRDARRAYSDAYDSPARAYAVAELHTAHRALERAEEAHEDDPGSDREAQLAYYAARKAEVARAHGEMMAAERAKAQAKATADYQGKLARTAPPVRDDRPAAAAKVDADADRDVDVQPRPARQPVPARRGDPDDDRRAAAALQSLSQVGTVKEEPRGVVITLSGQLLFPTGEAELSPIARDNLDKVAAVLDEHADDRDILIEAHTDSSGSERQNQQLSQRRAQAVADYLMQRDVDGDRMRVIGYGESRPIADNDTEQGRSTNRRVEIVVGRLDVDDD